MAVALVGSPDLVRDRMKCAESDFRDYCEGRREPDWLERERLVNLIIAEQRKVIARNRAALAALRSRRRTPG